MTRTKNWFKNLDDLLRGEKTEAHLLARGTQHIPLGATATAAAGLGIIYGVFMGLFAVMTRTPPSYLQMLSTALKVPALFFLTLVVTFPSLSTCSARFSGHGFGSWTRSASWWRQSRLTCACWRPSLPSRDSLPSAPRATRS